MSLWRRSLRVTVWIALGLFVLVAPWWYLDWKTERDLQAELQRIRDAGEPLTLAEAAPESVPPAENAAELYQQVLGYMAPRRGMGTSVFEASGQSTLIEEDYLDGNAPDAAARPVLEDAAIVRALETLRQASEREKCAFPVNWEDGPGALFPHYGRMRQAARWLSAKSKLCAHDGKTDEALDWCRVSLRMSQHVAQEPPLIAHLVAVAIQAIACERAQETLNAGPPSPEFAREMIEYLRSVDMRASYRRAMLGERAMGVTIFDMVGRGTAEGLLTGTNGPDVPGMFYRSPIGRPLLRSDETVFLELMRRQMELADTTPPDHRTRMLEDLQQDIPPLAIVTHIVYPVYSRSADKRDQAVANIDLFEIALAAESYRAEHGEWPADLQALQATLSYELPQDPFAGAPYRYRREQSGYIVYSPGPDLDDDGGHGPRDAGYGYDNCDIVWRVSR